MRITIELRRPARRSVAIVLGLLLLSAPAVALADHQFPDVPPGHLFHNEIGAIAEAGITAGDGNGNYNPSNPVSRGQMAAFMHRGLGRVALVTGTTTPSFDVAAGASFSSAVPVRDLTITVPGASNAFGPSQLINLTGRIAFSTSMSNAVKGCPCQFYAQIADVTGSQVFISWQQTFESSVNTTFVYAFEGEVLTSASPGPRTYRLSVGLSTRAVTTGAASFTLSGNSSLSAMNFPFGLLTP